MVSLVLEVPIKTVSGLNVREHWRVRANRVKAERYAMASCLIGKKLPPLPVTVTFTRLSKGELDDDNLPGAIKAIRDELAAWYGTPDNDRLFKFKYGQEKGLAAVRVEIEPL